MGDRCDVHWLWTAMHKCTYVMTSSTNLIQKKGVIICIDTSFPGGSWTDRWSRGGRNGSSSPFLLFCWLASALRWKEKKKDVLCKSVVLWMLFFYYEFIDKFSNLLTVPRYHVSHMNRTDVASTTGGTSRDWLWNNKTSAGYSFFLYAGSSSSEAYSLHDLISTYMMPRCI